MLFFAEKYQNHCRNIRFKLTDILSGHFIVFNTRWAREHIAKCPRCRNRLSGFSKVATGLSLLRTQPHAISLLSRANQQAIGVLRRDVRELPKALALKSAQPGPSLLARIARCTSGLGNAAACLAILILMRAEVFASMDKIQKDGRKATRQIYANSLGDDMADEIFPT